MHYTYDEIIERAWASHQRAVRKRKKKHDDPVWLREQRPKSYHWYANGMWNAVYY